MINGLGITSCPQLFSQNFHSGTEIKKCLIGSLIEQTLSYAV